VKLFLKLKWLSIAAFFFIAHSAFSQSNLCNGAAPFCTGTSYNFPATVTGTEAESGPDYGCLGSEPDPVWYYLQIANNGTIVMNIAGADPFNDDIDFACWGPFSTPTGACASGLTSNCLADGGCFDNTSGITTYPSGNLVDCSYDPQSAEVCTIPNAVSGQYYIVMITNFGGNNTNILFNQTNSGPGAGSTNCAIIPCNITGMTGTPGPCIAGNTFSITGTLTTTQPPSSGTLTITSSCGGSTTLNPPFASPLNYTITGSSATGGSCTLTATYSADPTCTHTMTVTAPGPCNPASCAISQVIATPGPCITAGNTYNVTGSISFSNAPATGSLTVSGSCGGTQTFTAPFASPINYTFSGLPSGGGVCTVTAVFSASVTCTNSANYTAPASCATCTVTATSNNACVGQVVNLTCSPSGATTYSWTGPNSFSSGLQNPSIVNAQLAATGTYSVTAHFPDGSVCSATTAVTVNAAPVADAGTDLITCVGSSVQLNGQGGTSYLWAPAATLDNPNISNPTASPATTTTYTLTVTSASGCTDTDDVTVTIVTTINATISSNVNICRGQSTPLVAGGGSTYTWTPTAGLSNAAIFNPVASPTVTTIYTVTVSAGATCPTATAAVAVNVTPNPTVTVSAPDTTCAGQQGTVHAYGATTYLWPASGITTDSIISNPSVTTNYTVIGANNNGSYNCTDTASGTIIVVPAPGVDFVTTTPEDPGDYAVTIENSDSLYNSYWVVNASDTLPYLPQFTYDFKQAGTYTVCLYGENSLGCPSYSCQELMLKGDWTIYIPNAFSPNGDGKNEAFTCYGINFTGFEMSIFDRWGEQIYKTSDINEGWKGNTKLSNTISPVDTYIYKIKIVDLNLSKHTFTGQVHVIR
jgi:gliding motility-associated-like protein